MVMMNTDNTKKLTRKKVSPKDKKVPKGFHKMPDGTIMKGSKHPKKKGY